MKHILLSTVPKTITHDILLRQRYVSPGQLKSGIQTINYVELKPQEVSPAHHHPDCEECFFVIEGSVQAQVVGTVFTLQVGDLLVVEPGELHQLANTSVHLCRFLQFRVKVRLECAK